MADGEVRLDADADQPRLLELQRVPVRQPQPVEVRPLLARGLDVLPLASQTAQAAGGRSPSAYCVPQVVRRKFGMFHHPLGKPYTPGVTSSTEFPAGSRK